MSAAIVTRGLGRRYGRSWVLRDVDLTVEEGSIYGLLGPNGAGKTTTLRILSTLLTPSAGAAWIGGYDVLAQPGRVRRQIGYMPDSFGVYDNLTVAEYLEFYAAAHGVPRGGRPVLDDLLTIVGLAERREQYVEALSRGMKQRLGIARCLVHDPPLLLLDEPASGLDPLARREMQLVMRELNRLGKTIVISSHILPELDQICSHIGIIQDGRLLVNGSVPELLAAAAGDARLEVELATADSAGTAAALLQGCSGVLAVEVLGSQVLATVEGGAETDRLLFQALGRAGLPVVRFGRKTVTLEEVYFSGVRQAGEAA